MARLTSVQDTLDGLGFSSHSSVSAQAEDSNSEGGSTRTAATKEALIPGSTAKTATSTEPSVEGMPPRGTSPTTTTTTTKDKDNSSSSSSEQHEYPADSGNNHQEGEQLGLRHERSHHSSCSVGQGMSESNSSGNNSGEMSAKSYVTSSSSSSLASAEGAAAAGGGVSPPPVSATEGTTPATTEKIQSSPNIVPVGKEEETNINEVDKIKNVEPGPNDAKTSEAASRSSIATDHSTKSKTLPTITELDVDGMKCAAAGKNKPSSSLTVGTAVATSVPGTKSAAITATTSALPTSSSNSTKRIQPHHNTAAPKVPPQSAAMTPSSAPKENLMTPMNKNEQIKQRTGTAKSSSLGTTPITTPQQATALPSSVPTHTPLPPMNVPPTVVVSHDRFPSATIPAQPTPSTIAAPSASTVKMPIVTSGPTPAATFQPPPPPTPPHHHQPPPRASSTTISTPNSSNNSKLSPNAPLRRGKWTVEEEAYVARVIQDFNSGFLNAPAGTTLRSYLSEKLHCDPMRITKKFTGDACIGKRVFHPAVRCASNANAIDKAQAELEALEQRWRRRLEMQQRESAKKAAASAAAAAAAATGRGIGGHIAQGVAPPPVHAGGTAGTGGGSGPSGSGVVTSQQQIKNTVVARTASWLDRATAVLGNATSSAGEGGSQPPSLPGSNSVTTGGLHQHGKTAAPISSPSPMPPLPAPAASSAYHNHAGSSNTHSNTSSPEAQEIEAQMNEVRRLIHEGPIIQQTTAGLPHFLHHNHSSVPTTTKPTHTSSTTGDSSSSATMQKLSDGQQQHRRIQHNSHTGAAAAPYTIPSAASGGGGISSTYHSASTTNRSGQYVGASGTDNYHHSEAPQDKRARRSNSPLANTSGAEDAEALVGFLNSVRASAAAAEGNQSI